VNRLSPQSNSIFPLEIRTTVQNFIKNQTKIIVLRVLTAKRADRRKDATGFVVCLVLRYCNETDNKIYKKSINYNFYCVKINFP